MSPGGPSNLVRLLLPVGTMSTFRNAKRIVVSEDHFTHFIGPPQLAPNLRLFKKMGLWFSKGVVNNGSRIS